MDYQQLLDLIVKFVLVPIIPLLGIYLTVFIQEQIDKIKIQADGIKLQTEIIQIDYYLDKAEKLIVASVSAVQQTFVDELKKEDSFTRERQSEAFNLAKQRILMLLKDEGIQAIEEVYGDYLNYIENRIENIIEENKKKDA